MHSPSYASFKFGFWHLAAISLHGFEYVTPSFPHFGLYSSVQIMFAQPVCKQIETILI